MTFKNVSKIFLKISSHNFLNFVSLITAYNTVDQHPVTLAQTSVGANIQSQEVN